MCADSRGMERAIDSDDTSRRLMSGIKRKETDRDGPKGRQRKAKHRRTKNNASEQKQAKMPVLSRSRRGNCQLSGIMHHASAGPFVDSLGRQGC